MKTIFSVLDKRSAKVIWRLTLLLVIGLTLGVVLLPRLFIWELFYIFPIILASWYGSSKSGTALALTSAVLLTGIRAFQNGYSHIDLLLYGLSCVVSFWALSKLIRNFFSVHRIESEAADTDFLTKIANARGFYVELANELVRASRYEHVFSLAYIDIDEFKRVNDSLGHAEGDRLLVRIAKCLNDSLRETDTVARLGGDEFACLLPETDQEEAKKAIMKTRTALDDCVKKQAWPVSFSIGLVTFRKMPADIRAAIKIADELMYTVKGKKKNNIAYTLWLGQ